MSNTADAGAAGIIRRRYIITGGVQGVGFRPFVYRTALEHSMLGWVLNSSDGVTVEVEGPATAVHAFGADLREKVPPLAHIVDFREESITVLAEESEFSIKMSSSGGGHHVLISPDTATCADCFADMADPDNRRYLYPFTNCTNCGPRYTITRSIPYDRETTSMACFPMCPECKAEYTDPLDRRFHAQPNACPVCGPQVWLTDREGKDISRGPDSLLHTAQRLAQGKLAAIKGLGGFHLVCDATDHAAVTQLRRRKKRPDKPLAIMVPNIAAARNFAEINAKEEELLSGIIRPIVLCRSRLNSEVSPAVAPDTHFIGLMLPYTPLHQVLFHHYAAQLPDGKPAALVMTSGNMSNEPISLGNREALQRLADIVDCFLFHNRDILIRTDDSVVRTVPYRNPESDEVAHRVQYLRRARGYTPTPVFLSESGPAVLGLGPHLKNTLCLLKGDQAFVGQHIGDLENLETFGFYKEILAHLQDILQTRPELLVRDLHPDYLSTRYALEQSELPVLALQHHFAHIYSVLAENKHKGPALGLALDGTGYGEDGTLWGGELLMVDTETLEQHRLAHFSPMLLPGGEAAILEPWRIAQGMLFALGIEEPDDAAPPWPWLEEYAEQSRMLPQLLKKRINTPVSTGCGRLFDAVSAQLGLKRRISYEGQAAIVLERIQDPAEDAYYACPLITDKQPCEIATQELFRAVYEDICAGIPGGVIARRFHMGLIQGLAATAKHFADSTGIRTVGLSGGVMQNLTLAVELPVALRKAGLVPLFHNLVPPNDACISLGQAFWGRRKLLSDKA